MSDVLGIGHAEELAGKGINIENTEFNDYYTTSRYKPFLQLVDALKKYNIKSIVDIGTSSGHLPFICLKNGIDAVGLDIAMTANINTPFIKHFRKECIFYGNFNEPETLLKYPCDCVVSMNLTHIFDFEAMKHLLKIFSNMAKLCIVHMRNPNIMEGQTVLEIIPTYDNTFLAVVQLEKMEIPTRKFYRTGQTIYIS